MFRFLVRRRGVGVAIHLHEHEARRVILLLDDIEARHARLFQTFLRVGERGLFEGLKVFRFDMNVNVNHKHGATNMRKRGQSQARNWRKFVNKPG